MVDAANVIGSRPTGWWRDRAGAAQQFVRQVRAATRYGRIPPPVVVVLEGAACAGAPEADVDGARVVHAANNGDDAVVAQVSTSTTGVVVVTADRRLADRVRELGAKTVGPKWLNDRLRPDGT